MYRRNNYIEIGRRFGTNSVIKNPAPMIGLCLERVDEIWDTHRIARDG